MDEGSSSSPGGSASAGGLRSAAAWLDPAQVDLASSVASQAGLRLDLVGSPTRGMAGELAARLGAQPADDLRSILMSSAVEVVWILAPGDFGTGARAADAEALAACRSRGGKVVSLEPIPASVLDLASPAWGGVGRDGPRAGTELARFGPSARSSRLLRDAGEVLEAFGRARAMSLEFWAGPGEGSLGARLVDALDLVDWLIGEPETVDAVYVGEASAGGVHLLPGESLRGLSGVMTANLRFADGRGASIVVGDAGGGGSRWRRAISLVGPGGRLRLDEDGLEWIGPGGETIDSGRAGEPGAVISSGSARAMAEHLRAAAEGRTSEAPMKLASVLASAGAALLSARTGEGESPATLLRMASVG